MKKIIYSLKSITILTLILGVSVSCDRDFSNIESDIQGIKNFEATSELFPMVATTRLFTPFTPAGSEDFVGVQADNFSGALLGVYKDPSTGNVFGTTEFGIVSQLIPTAYNRDFGEDPIVESVILNIPYFSTLQETDGNGESTYDLDSIFGNTNATYKLSIYRNKYVLRDLNPDSGFEDPQCYYSNQKEAFKATVSASDLLYQNDNFKPDDAEIDIPGETVDDETIHLAPALRIDLFDQATYPSVVNPEFWTEFLNHLKQNPEVVSNQNLFTEYFRGLIFEVETNNVNGDGSVIYLNLDAGSLILDYTNTEEIISEEPFEARDATAYRLEFNGNTVNTFNTISNEDVDGREDNLYLKGGDGSFAVLDLFSGDDLDGNGLSDIEDEFRSKKEKWLINEANIVFYVNKEAVNGEEPERVILYDLKNNEPIVDYLFDGTANNANPSQSRIQFSEVLNRDSSGDGVRYKFRITNHINNILQKDSTNVKLGLYLTYNINQSTDTSGDIKRSKIQGVNTDEDDLTINVLPPTSILSPKGTILYGSGNLPEGQKAEFEIFYTEPEN